MKLLSIKYLSFPNCNVAKSGGLKPPSPPSGTVFDYRSTNHESHSNQWYDPEYEYVSRNARENTCRLVGMVLPGVW